MQDVSGWFTWRISRFTCSWYGLADGERLHYMLHIQMLFLCVKHTQMQTVVALVRCIGKWICAWLLMAYVGWHQAACTVLCLQGNLLCSA